ISVVPIFVEEAAFGEQARQRNFLNFGVQDQKVAFPALRGSIVGSAVELGVEVPDHESWAIVESYYAEALGQGGLALMEEGLHPFFDVVVHVVGEFLSVLDVLLARGPVLHEVELVESQGLFAVL